MNYDTALLEAELAAYSPAELEEFAQTLSVLFDAADDDSTHYAATRQRIEDRFSQAAKARMRVERDADRTATIVPFPRKPK